MKDTLKFKYGPKDIAALFLDSVVIDVCSTTAFKRLKDISFLGAIDYEKGFRLHRQNRYDHSVGVALLAQHYAQKMEFSGEQRRAIVLAALLHDVGHAPLSHSLEPLFYERFGLNHHVATNELLKGKVPLGGELSQLLRNNNIDAERLIELMAGKDDSEEGRIFSSPINVDTIEAIWRGGSYLRKWFVNPVTVLDEFLELDRNQSAAMERFWSEKNSFYQLMIYSRTGIGADHRARLMVERNICPNDFYSTEKEFFANRRPSSDALRKEFADFTVTVKVRKFEVNTLVKRVTYESIREKFKITRAVKDVAISGNLKSVVQCEQETIF
ncbi:HD domain-containing protein [Cupriavidus alkaliphilus]|uniref:HD domain-containing protein n=1 Tax=Cupriavidus alkaliphilus TaxID=942866 RepID=UPI00339D5FEB